MRGAVVYSYANAKARAIRSRRLSSEDWHFLKSSHSLERVLQYLSTTSYAPFIASREETASSTGSLSSGNAGPPSALLPEKKIIERGLYRSLTEDYHKIVRSLRGEKQRALILSLYSRFEAENLKILMRAVFSGRSRQEVEHLLYPLGALTRMPWEELWTFDRMTEVRDRLARTLFGPALRFAFPQFEAQGRLFPLEMAVDRACFQELSRAREALPRADRQAAGSVLGPFVDLVNISWIIRLRERYGLEPEQIVNYTLPGGRLVTLRVIARLVQATDVASFVERLPPPAARRMDDVTDWKQVVERFRLLFLERVRRAFTGPPFTIGVEVACLLEEEMEIERLITVIESAASVLSDSDVAQEASSAPEEATLSINSAQAGSRYMEQSHVQAG